MKTIKERAREKYPEVIKHHNLALIDINEEKRKMYIEIATEQKAVDIKKICDWLPNCFIIEHGTISIVGCDVLLRELHKAMEE